MSSLALANFSYGVIAALCWVVGLYFLGFWRKTRDRFFGYFAAAFWLLGLGRLAMAALGETSEARRFIYLLRLVAYAVFLVAIVDKNRTDARGG
ncbi:MAG TPA: DUF5985 family protein [Myxococcales bacterium]|nr:DUF5985 family protein [Myxococcales bacterium]